MIIFTMNNNKGKRIQLPKGTSNVITVDTADLVPIDSPKAANSVIEYRDEDDTSLQGDEETGLLFGSHGTSSPPQPVVGSGLRRFRMRLPTFTAKNVQIWKTLFRVSVCGTGIALIAIGLILIGRKMGREASGPFPGSSDYAVGERLSFFGDIEHLYIDMNVPGLTGTTQVACARGGQDYISVGTQVFQRFPEANYGRQLFTQWRLPGYDDEVDASGMAKPSKNVNTAGTSLLERSREVVESYSYLGVDGRITIHLPQNRHYKFLESRSLSYRRSRPDHLWNIEVGNMTACGITFDRLSLMTTSGEITVEDVEAKYIDIRSENNSIRGHWNATGYALLEAPRGGVNFVTRGG